MLCDLCEKEERIGQLLCATCLETIERLARVTGYKPPMLRPPTLPEDGPTGGHGRPVEKYFETAASIGPIPVVVGGDRKGMLSAMFEASHVREWAYRGCACKNCQEERARNMKERLGLEGAQLVS